MDSSGGTSSGSSLIQTSGSEENLQALMDQRKRKRMISNRESARRSRMKKQKHLEELNAQVAQLRIQNNHIASRMNAITHHYLQIEEENSVLRAQIGELSHRLQSLNEISSFSLSGLGLRFQEPNVYGVNEFGASEGFLMNNPWNQSITASAEMLQY